MTLAHLLAPITVDQFIHEYLGQQFLHMPGQAGRFEHLVSWPELEVILSQLRVDDNRVALVKQGKFISQETYTYTSLSGRIRYLIGPAVNAHVCDGATLVVNHVDTLFPWIRRLVESCEETVEVHVAANLYAGWRTDKGFDMHWDKHDTLIVQVVGRKDWKVWRPTRVHPLPDDLSEPVGPLKEDLVWQGLLMDGAVLYMPRGWWHVATPCDEPSLHITIGIKQPTGADFLQWIVHKMKACADVRRDVPHLQSDEHRRAWLGVLRDAFSSAIRNNALDDYIDSLVHTTQPRPIVRFPDVTTARILQDLNTTDALRLVRLRRLRIRKSQSPGMITFAAGAKRWDCSAHLRPALELLHATVPCTLDQLRSAVGDRAEPLLHTFIMTLIAAGIVWVDGADSSETSQGRRTRHQTPAS